MATGAFAAGFLAAVGAAFLTTAFLAAGFLAAAGLPPLATGLAAGLLALLAPKTMATFARGAACETTCRQHRFSDVCIHCSGWSG